MVRDRSRGEGRGGGASDIETKLREQANSELWMKQMPRRWQAGDVYSPRDMSPGEHEAWRVGGNRAHYDIVDTLGLRPLDLYKVGYFPIFSHFFFFFTPCFVLSSCTIPSHVSNMNTRR